MSIMSWIASCFKKKHRPMDPKVQRTLAASDDVKKEAKELRENLETYLTADDPFQEFIVDVYRRRETKRMLDDSQRDVRRTL